MDSDGTLPGSRAEVLLSSQKPTFMDHCVPGTVLNALHGLAHLHLTTTHWRGFFYPLLTDENNEVWRDTSESNARD